MHRLFGPVGHRLSGISRLTARVLLLGLLVAAGIASGAAAQEPSQQPVGCYVLERVEIEWRAPRFEGWESRFEKVEQQLEGAEHALRYAWTLGGNDYGIQSTWTAPPQVLCPGDSFHYEGKLLSDAPSGYGSPVVYLSAQPTLLGQASDCALGAVKFGLDGDAAETANPCQAVLSEAAEWGSEEELVLFEAETSWLGIEGINVTVKYVYAKGSPAPEPVEVTVVETALVEAAATVTAEDATEEPGVAEEATPEVTEAEPADEAAEPAATEEGTGAEAAEEATEVEGAEEAIEAEAADEAVPGTESAVDDMDGDGLSDEEEERLGTDPLDPNSDGDEMRDGPEAEADRDPLDPSDGIVQDDEAVPSPGPCEGLDEGVWLVIGTGSAVQGKTVRIPVSLCNAAGLGDLNATIAFDPQVLRATGVMGGSLLDEALFDANTEPQGTIRFGVADADGLSGDGSLASLGFEIIGESGSRTSLDGRVAVAHDLGEDQTVWVAVRDGSFEVEREGLKGDWNSDLRVNSVDALAALRMSVGKIPQDPVLDMNEDGLVTAEDARWILEVAALSRTL